MPIPLKLIGSKFGRLTVISQNGHAGADRVWQCVCDCGISATVSTDNLRSGNTRSCGCLKRDAVIKRNVETAMKKRLLNPPKLIARNDKRTFGELAVLFSDSQAVEISRTAGWQGKSGIYALVNRLTGKLYVGSTVSLKGRIHYHWTKLRQNKHDNSYLQRSWNIHGEAAFVTIVIEQCSVDSLIEREGFWIAMTKAADKAYGYNLDTIVVRKMHCEETKAKIGAAHIGKPKSAEHRQKLSAAKMGVSTGKRTPEQRANYSKARTGAKHSEETKRKMSLARTGKIITAEHRAKISAAFKGKKQSSEHVQKRVSAAKMFLENRKKEGLKCQLFLHL